MSTRTDRHREMGEALLTGYQGLTRAKVEGKEPVIVAQPPLAHPIVVYTPQFGDMESHDMPMAVNEASLKELRLYWQRIPDFGIERFEIFTSESGWAQVLYWKGTGDDGNVYLVQEVDIVHTDDDFNVTRYEAYADSMDWLKVVTYTMNMTEEEIRSGNYADHIESAQ